jgi:hypothetical protein
MIFTKLRLLVSLVLCCIAWNADAACHRATARGSLLTVWHQFSFGTPVTRQLDFSLDFDGHKCRIYQSYGPGPFMKQWSAASDDGRCIMMVDIQAHTMMIRLDGLVHFTNVEADEVSSNPKTTDIQHLLFHAEFSKWC